MNEIFDVIGLAGCFVGIVMMTRYSLPGHLPQINGKEISEKGRVEDGRRNLIGLGGLMCLAVGTAFQILARVL